MKPILYNGIWILDEDSHVSRWVRETGRLDHDRTVDELVKLIKPGDYVVDAGANIGSHTIAYLRAVGPAGMVVCYEPNPDAFACLTENCPEARLYEAGLSDRYSDGEHKLNYQDNVGASYLEPHTGGHVQLRALDDNWDRARCDFIKLDVEGWEHRALLGAARTIKTFKPILFVEINEGALRRNNTSTTALLYLIRALGYAHRRLDGLPCEGPQYDVLCLPSQ